MWIEHLNHQHPSTIRGPQLLNLLTSSADRPLLEDINLDSCGLGEIPSPVFQLTHIHTLSLYDNRLAALPDDINLDGCGLDEVLAAIFQLTGIHTISVGRSVRVALSVSETIG